ncbi:MAG: DUF5683 domain-containing protein [Bacteroides sp.]|nr:DUF5683 domain-containing protein [Bacteroides sp.]
MQSAAEKANENIRRMIIVFVGMALVMLTSPFNIFSETLAPVDNDTVPVIRPTKPNRPVRPTRRNVSPVTAVTDTVGSRLQLEVTDSLVVSGDSVSIFPIDTVAVAAAPPINPNDSVADLFVNEEKTFTFVPNPTKAVWMSALFPGLGQLYNRRYWKLPIVIGAYMGLGYATNWNNTMLRDYTRAYSDIMDSDPNTKSYMDFFAPTVKEDDLDKTWLTDLLRRRKNYYRRNRDLCIICMIGVYAIAMIDAYVDAQLAHFDITPNLSVDVAPTLLPQESSGRFSMPGVGVYWALNF